MQARWGIPAGRDYTATQVSVWRTGSVGAGRGAIRCVSVDSSSSKSGGEGGVPLQDLDSEKVAPKEMAATVPGASTLGIPKSNKAKQSNRFNTVLGLQPEKHGSELYAIFKADSLSRFYVPAVMMGHSAPPPSSSRTVHILGKDEKSKFLSHALHGIYDAVEPLNLHRETQYPNVSGSMGKHKRNGVWVERNLAITQEAEADTNETHISNLVVAGRPIETIKLLESVKHRVDDRTAICYMQDGLGIAEAVNNKVFTDPKKRPSTVLGHLSTALAYNRESNSVRIMDYEYKTALTGVRPWTAKNLEAGEETWLRTQGMLERFAHSPMLRAQGIELDRWMKLKISSLMFSAVIDPICVLLDARYDEVLSNSTADKLIVQLLAEIAEVVGHMPEVRRSSPELVASLRGELLRKQVIGKLRGKKTAQSKMVAQINRGALTDIDFLNGFFIMRGKRMGIKMPANELVIRKARLEQLKAQGGGGGGGSGNQKAAQAEQRQQQEANARQQILNQILHPEAADRLGRIRLVKEQRAVDVENRLITLAQTGQLRSKVTEAQLKELLAAVADNKEEEKIVVSRRKGWDDDDDDLLDL
ncbi:hypothetical protein CSOJ01_06433 [Colletotrichum sojae]|uniref:Ketopantoate reductase N-terminal domain-containing protein n=1 Tax=Colletotrichum sojae TaxID=2175907 RepID=A0A8H6MV87_9PEZI|nr:hypothetical protein CSOJ01_06433 [Colletotrichum sojae]